MSITEYLLGYDLGSSFIKASLIDAQTGDLVAKATSTDTELTINSPKPGWAEQDPEMWWKNIVKATLKLKIKVGNKLKDVKAIGITYQMHGLVILDKDMNVLYPSIIWCDSRAVKLGNEAFTKIGEEKCLTHLLNSPGNFTASKLAWIKKYEPRLYKKIYKFMLPGDYIAYKMTGEVKTTVTGLSEGILWDYKKQDVADMVLEYYGIPKRFIPDIVPVFSIQGKLTKEAAELTGLPVGVPISYRAGDQPNNAFSLNVLKPGEIAATTGTSGVVYGVGDKPISDKKSRVNVFVHVNHTQKNPRYGTLLCLNGAGILNSWSKNILFTLTKEKLDYDEMNRMAEEAPIGSGGLCILPYGNGAERTLENKNIGASIHGLNLTMHKKPHLFRAVQEGVVFAMNYGLKIMKDMGLSIKVIKTGYANMFLSPLFASAFSTLTNTVIELYDTDGAKGAALGAGIGAGIYPSAREAFKHLKIIKTIRPDPSQRSAYQKAYERWEACLRENLL